MTRERILNYSAAMKIAIISDIHGNWPAFEAVLKEIDSLEIEKIYCLGDVVNPLPSSRKVFESLLEKQIPLLRGNHEDYIISSWNHDDGPMNSMPQYRPIQIVAKTFSQNLIWQLETLPLTLNLKNTAEKEVLLCHASPSANNKGWQHGFDESVAESLRKQTAEVIVCGHWHHPESRSWSGKTLVTVGSVGLPLAGKPAAEFLVLEGHGDWRASHHIAAYDSEQAVDEYLRSGFFAEGGPIAWLLMWELASSCRQLSHYFNWLKSEQLSPKTMQEWQDCVLRFLEVTGVWDDFHRRFKNHLRWQQSAPSILR